MFEESKFAELDAMADKIRAGKSRYPDGGWKLLAFYQGFDLTGNYPQWVFTSYLERAKEWRRVSPQSVTAQVVLGQAWYNYAWNERGHGYANEVKEKAWPIVYERLDKAWQIVNEHPAQGIADCPERHALRLKLANAKGVERKQFEALFQEAVRFEPGYYAYYFNKAEYLQPRWHGDEGEWQKFITEAARNNANDEGDTIYTRTAWSKHGIWKNFNNEGIYWDKMKTGFEQMLHNYPDSPFILNGFARFACLAGDLDTMKVLFKRIDTNNYYPEVWNNYSIEDCRNWVKFGKSRLELDKEKRAEHMKQFEVKVFQNVLELAEKGNRKVMGDLAEMYLKGRGTKVDPVAAYAWFAQDESANKDQLVTIATTLTAQQLVLAKQQAEAIKRRTAQ